MPINTKENIIDEFHLGRDYETEIIRYTYVELTGNNLRLCSKFSYDTMNIQAGYWVIDIIEGDESYSSERMGLYKKFTFDLFERLAAKSGYEYHDKTASLIKLLLDDLSVFAEDARKDYQANPITDKHRKDFYVHERIEEREAFTKKTIDDFNAKYCRKKIEAEQCLVAFWKHYLGWAESQPTQLDVLRDIAESLSCLVVVVENLDQAVRN